MLKGLPKKEVILDEEKNRKRLESDIAQLINENNSLKTQITNLVAQLDYLNRSVEKQMDALDKKEKKIEKQTQLANKHASDIISKAHDNADIIIQEVISSAHDVLKEISLLNDSSPQMMKRLEFKTLTLKHILSGIDQEELKNLILFNDDHDTFFKK
ncbi:MAG TPA: hypothetical protein VFC75_01620 [Erysipelothrix sp.]|nr:hypothetical protein [Erysipelothrix sp.]